MDTESLKKSLLSKFVEVTGDRLQTIQLGAIDLEKADAEQAAEAVARELHTMKGEARIVVGSRTLVEYIFEPIRQLRENMRN